MHATQQPKSKAAIFRLKPVSPSFLFYLGEIKKLDENACIRSLPVMTFHRGGIDSFVMTTRRSLGELLYLRIWHDNTGVWNAHENLQALATQGWQP